MELAGSCTTASPIMSMSEILRLITLLSYELTRLNIFIMKQLAVFSEPNPKSASKARLDQLRLRVYRFTEKKFRGFYSLYYKIASPESSFSRTQRGECFDEK